MFIIYPEKIDVHTNRYKKRDAEKLFPLCKFAKVLALLLKHALKIRSKCPE